MAGVVRIDLNQHRSCAYIPPPNFEGNYHKNISILKNRVDESEFDSIVSRLNHHRFWFPWKMYYYGTGIIAVVATMIITAIIYKIVENGGGSHTVTLIIFSLLILGSIAVPFGLYFLFAKKLRYNFDAKLSCDIDALNEDYVDRGIYFKLGEHVEEVKRKVAYTRHSEVDISDAYGDTLEIDIQTTGTKTVTDKIWHCWVDMIVYPPGAQVPQKHRHDYGSVNPHSQHDSSSDSD